MGSIEIGREVIGIEIAALEFMRDRLDDNFEKASKAIFDTSGRTIICGMGKSGLIGKKIMATFASTGTPSFFMHPGEAFHGDLGMVQPEDVFVAISNSGETDEVLKLLPFLRDNGNYLIAITGNAKSTLAKSAHCHLDIAVPKEACPLQLAPTSSTTATLVMGDALAVTLMDRRSFKPENFARFHPGGSLGRRLLGKVQDEMVTENLPLVSSNTPIQKVIAVMTEGMQGVALVIDEGEMVGIITDGDLRRAMENLGHDIFSRIASDICTYGGVKISPDSSILAATELMTSKNINSLVVHDGSDVVGLLKK